MGARLWHSPPATPLRSRCLPQRSYPSSRPHAATAPRNCSPSAGRGPPSPPPGLALPLTDAGSIHSGPPARPGAEGGGEGGAPSPAPPAALT